MTLTHYDPEDITRSSPEQKELHAYSITIPAGPVENYEPCGTRLNLNEAINFIVQASNPRDATQLFITGQGEVIHLSTGRTLLKLDESQFTVGLERRNEL
ncbi:hypothetical protein CbuD7E6568_05700 [Coxiella burnetii]|nr:hypothetical protein [Coxiella burnetii]OYK80258.1 hypothetical protein CbuD7E6568_05700 [Coxiella burnetii]